MKITRWLLLLGGAALLAALYQSYLSRYLTLESLQQHQQALAEQARTFPLRTRLLFFLLYVAAATLCVPGTMLLTIASGAIFGYGWGLVLSSFASSIGGLLAFGLARFVWRDALQKRFGERLRPIHCGLQAHGSWYLLSLRLLPVVPYFAINLAMGLSNLRSQTFYWVSQIGMLASTLIYVNAGRQLATLHSLADLYTPERLASFTLLAALPLGALALRQRP